MCITKSHCRTTVIKHNIENQSYFNKIFLNDLLVLHKHHKPKVIKRGLTL